MPSKEKKTRALLLCAVSLLIFFLGVEAGGFQLALLRIAVEFKLDSVAMGRLAAAQFVPIILTPLLIGGLSDRIGKRRVLIIFATVFIAGCLITSASGSAAVFALGIVVVGAGYSICESVSSALLSDVFDSNAEKYMNIAQGCFSMGAVIGPLAASFFISRCVLGWRMLFLACALGYILLIPLLLAVRVRGNRQAYSGRLPVRKLFSPIFSLLFLSILLYVGMENGLAFFLDSLFTHRLGASELSAAAISIFWLFMAISRFCFGMARRVSPWILTACFGASALFLTVLGLALRADLALLCCAVLGALCGPVWPSLVAMCAQEHPAHTGQATGMMSAGCGVGGVASPVLMGWLMNRASIGEAFVSLAALAVCGGVLVALSRRARRNAQPRI